MAQKKPVIMIYIMLIFFAVSLAFLLNIFFQTNKSAYFAYLFFKVFFIVIFTLWMHKYLTNRFIKMLDIKENEEEDNS
jgi:NhaP-type Na+/H+ or K+/H+ antiporter